MKLMVLDRENESLLHKTTLPPHMKTGYGKVAVGQLAKAHGKFSK